MTATAQALARILVVEDEESDFFLLQRRLKNDGLPASCLRVSDYAALDAALDEGGWSILLSDYRVPGMDLKATLERVRARAPALPVILVSGNLGEERAVALLREGVSDFVLKDNLIRLVPAIRRAQAECAEREARRAAEEALRSSEGRCRALMETSFDRLWELDAAGRYTFVSPRSLDILGFAPEELLGSRPVDRMAPEEAGRVGALLGAILAERRPFARLENVCLAKDGRRVVLETSGVPILGPAGELLGYRGTDRDITATHEAESRLRLQGAALETTANAVVIAGRDGTIEWVNAAFTAITGYTLEEAQGRTPGELLHSDLQDRSFYEELWRTILDGRPWHGELINRRKDGRLYFEDMTVTPVPDADGVVRHFVAIKQDIGERKQAERALREREMQYRGVIETSVDGFLILDTRGRVLEVNDAYVRRCGYSRAELLRMSLSELVDASQLGALAERFARVMALGSDRFESLHRSARGEMWPVEVTVSYWPIAGGRLFAFLRDISAERAAQAELDQYRHRLEELVETRTLELKAAEEHTRLILESTADGLYGVDEQGRCTFINPAACAILGYKPEEILGRNTHDLIHNRFADGSPYPREQCPLEATIVQNRIFRREDEVFWRADGRPIPVVYATHPLHRQGRIVGAVVNFSDIGARRAAESERDRALAEAERLAQVKSEFLANMSHEIRTPLNAVLGLAQLGQKEGPGPRTRERFARILDSGQLLLGIVDDILDYSKLEAGRLSLEDIPFSLGDVIDRAVDLTAPRAFLKGIAFRVDEAPDLPERLTGDSLRTSQILVNLLSNAVKFTDRGAVALSVSQDGSTLSFRVADTGIGIGPRQMASLFLPFQQADGSTTRRFGGTGLGLTISRRLARMMGGNIEVASRQGEGTVFVLRLPLRGAVPAAAPAGDPKAILAGLDEREAMRLAAALRQRGLAVEQVPLGRAFSTPGDVVVVEGEALTEPRAATAALFALESGRTLALVCSPGEGQVLVGTDFAGLHILDRPLRARHVIAAIRRDPRDHRSGPPEARRLAGLRLLAAEDNEINRLVLEDLLREEGAELATVENGRQAVERVERDGPGAWDLLLMDVQMPEMDGYTATGLVRGLDPALPVVGLTAHAMPEERARCLAAGMVGHLAKPYDLNRLVHTILKRARRTAADGAGPVAACEAPSAAADSPPQPAPGRAGEPEPLPLGPGARAAPDPEPRALADGPGADPGPKPGAPEGADAPAAGLIDWAALEDRFPSGAAFVDRLAARVIEGHGESAARLRTLAAAADYRELVLLGHTLKGMLGNLLIHDLREKAAALENAARQQEVAALELAGTLAVGMERLLAELALRLAGSPAAQSP